MTRSVPTRIALASWGLLAVLSPRAVAQGCAGNFANMPTVVSSVTSASTPIGIYSIGGHSNATGGIVANVQRLNKGGTWTPEPKFPIVIRDAGCAYDAPTNKIFVFGGASNVPGVLRSIYSAQPVAGRPTTFAAVGNLTVAREAPGVVRFSRNGLIYIFGGLNNSGLLSSAEVFNPKSPSTPPKRIASMPQPLAHPEAAEFGSYIYIFGGHANLQKSLVSSRVFRYDPITDCYCEVVPKMPPPYDKGVTTLTATTTTAGIVLTGGVLQGPSIPNQCTNVSNAVLLFVPRDPPGASCPAPTGPCGYGATFQTLKNLCVPRQGHGAQVLDGATAWSIVVFGGCDGAKPGSGNLVAVTEGIPPICQLPTAYGAATPHCNGAPEIAGSGCPLVGNKKFAIKVSNAIPTGGLGVGAVMMMSLASGSGTFPCTNAGGGQFTLNVMPSPFSTLWVLLPISIDRAGNGTLPIEIPPAPVLRGLKVYLQFYENHPTFCSPCRFSGVGGSASRGLLFVVQ